MSLKIEDDCIGCSFRIRCKVIRKSVVRSFGVGNKMFDAIACDRSGEIKLVAYNDQVDRFYELVPVNRVSDSTVHGIEK